MENIIILGTGCAGLTAGIYTARANLNPLILEGRQPGGQLTTTSEVENFPGFPQGVDGYSLMDQLRKQATRFGARIENSFIDKVELGEDKKVLFAGDKKFEAKAIIIATGAAPRLLGVPGEKEMYGGKGVTTCATCDGFFFRDKEIAVVGGGDSAMEEANFLTKFASKVTLLHRREEFRASRIMLNRAKENPKVEFVTNVSVEEILESEEGGAVRGLRLKDTLTGGERGLKCEGVFMAIGHIPNSDIFRNSITMDEQGYILTAPDSTATNIKGVFACGDVQDTVYRQAVTAAGSGCMAAIEAERFLSH